MLILIHKMAKEYILAWVLISTLAIVYAQENTNDNLTIIDNTTLTFSNETNTSNISNETLDEQEMAANETINTTPEQKIDNDTIKVSTPICNETLCDNSCIICSDQKCHPPDFMCIESVAIEKFFPNSMVIGANQINILLRNKGHVDLHNIYAELSGDGITTTDKIPLDKLAAGEKDYTFTKITASKSGVIDLVIKLFINDSLKEKKVEQLTVIEEKKPEAKAEENISMISSQIENLKETYKELEEDYQNKKLADYPVDIVYDNLKEASTYIKDAKISLLEGNYKNSKNNIDLAQESLSSIEEELKNAKKKEVSSFDKLRNKLVIFGSMAAAIISILTAWGLIRSHASKIKDVKNKLKNKKSDEKKEEKTDDTK